jgi:hypothetical protein
MPTMREDYALNAKPRCVIVTNRDMVMSICRYFKESELVKMKSDLTAPLHYLMESESFLENLEPSRKEGLPFVDFGKVETL